MANLATRCTACGTVFRVVRDQLRVAEGLVRCGRCGEVFNAAENLVAAEELFAAQPPAPPPPSVPPHEAVDLGLSVAAAEAPPSPWANLDLADPPAEPPPAPRPGDFDLAFDGIEAPPAAPAGADLPGPAAVPADPAAPSTPDSPATWAAGPDDAAAAPAAPPEAPQADAPPEAPHTEVPVAPLMDAAAPAEALPTPVPPDPGEPANAAPWAPSTVPGAWTEAGPEAAASGQPAAEAASAPILGPSPSPALDTVTPPVQTAPAGPEPTAVPADPPHSQAHAELPAPEAATAPAADAPPPAWDPLDLRAERDPPAGLELDLPDLRAIDPPAARAEAAPVDASRGEAWPDPLVPGDAANGPEAGEPAAEVPDRGVALAFSPAAQALAAAEPATHAEAVADADGPTAEVADPAADAHAPDLPAAGPSNAVGKPPGASADAAPAHPTVDDLAPSFLQGPPPSVWDRPAAKRSAAAACALATLVLAAQGVYTFRDTVAATVPALREPLVQLCAALGCRVSAERHLAGLAVDASSLLRVDRSNLYQLQLTVRNRSPRDVALPALDLTLNNGQGQVVARRMVTLAELGVTDTTLAAGRALQVQATLQALLKPAETVAGYTLDLYYP